MRVGWLTRGSHTIGGSPIGFDVGTDERYGTLPGLDQGVRGMHVGGQRKLLVPPELVNPPPPPPTHTHTHTHSHVSCCGKACMVNSRAFVVYIGSAGVPADGQIEIFCRHTGTGAWARSLVAPPSSSMSRCVCCCPRAQTPTWMCINKCDVQHSETDSSIESCRSGCGPALLD